MKFIKHVPPSHKQRQKCCASTAHHLLLVTTVTFVTNAKVPIDSFYFHSKKNSNKLDFPPTTVPNLACTPLSVIGMLLTVIVGGGQKLEVEL